MGYTTGTQVQWTQTSRKLKDGLKKSNYDRCFKRLYKTYIGNLRDKTNRTNFYAKHDKLMDKFYSNETETNVGVGVIETRDRLSNKEWYFTLKGVDGTFIYEELTPFVKDIKLAKLLRDCEVGESLLTRTGKFYYYKGILVMEHVTSTGNVWVDDAFAETMSLDKWKDFELEVLNFVHNAKHVSKLPITSHIKERDEIFSEIFKKYLVDSN